MGQLRTQVICIQYKSRRSPKTKLEESARTLIKTHARTNPLASLPQLSEVAHVPELAQIDLLRNLDHLGLVGFKLILVCPSYALENLTPVNLGGRQTPLTLTPVADHVG